MKNPVVSLAAGAALSIGCASAANATTITINNTTNAQISCVSTSNPALNPACQAFSGGSPNGIGHGVGDPSAAGTLGLTADLYDGVPAGDSFELAQIKILAGDNSLTSLVKGPDDPGVFMSSALYILLKLSNTAVWLINLSGGELTVTYTESTCNGGVNQNCFKAGGLSHYSEVGGVGEIPIPAALWLMGSGLAGLGFASRRKKAR